MLPPRKSCRRRILTSKVRDHEPATNNAETSKKRKSGQEPPVPATVFKRARSEPEPVIAKIVDPVTVAPKTGSTSEVGVRDDKIDPVEKLLSLTCASNDILHMDDSDAEPSSPLASSTSTASAYPSLTLNFTKAINDNLRSYYLRLCRSPMEIHNDHSSFSVLNHKPLVEERPCALSSASQVPFFKNVNFSSSPSFHRLDDYIYCDDDDEPSSTDSEHEEMPASDDPILLPLPSTGKMSFRYRQNDKLNLSLSDSHPDQEPEDIYKFLNKRSVISGRASEMIGTSPFMIKDFFF